MLKFIKLLKGFEHFWVLWLDELRLLVERLGSVVLFELLVNITHADICVYILFIKFYGPLIVVKGSFVILKVIESTCQVEVALWA